ncbi:MAG TPA: alpha/beta hydrolase [Verrucomicrobiae bacterium]|jgi:acetyl esterase|nr:alpha/beta hydrolase [Verrucomicrobiae bacterium]
MSGKIIRSERLDAEARALLERLDAQGAPPLASLTPAQARVGAAERYKVLGGEPETLARVEDHFIPGPAGDVPVRLYAGEQSGLRPALIYFHGGGFVLGNLDTHDSLCRSLAKESGAVVIAVDYRLAPEHKFPAAVEDAHAVTKWVGANAQRLGIDPNRVAIGGDSAGGNLATVIALRCRDAGGPPLAMQVLIYPVTDMSSFETGSYRVLEEGYFLGRAEMAWFAGHYLPSPEAARNPEASPLLAADLTRLPPALVITAEFDPLRDEGEAYAWHLQQAGVPVTLTRYSGTIHGFVAMRGVLSSGQQAIREVGEFIRTGLEAGKALGAQASAPPQA